MREIRTYSLSGGRWPARKRATSDPTAMRRSNVRRAKGPCCTACWSSTGGRGELINAPINLQDRKHQLCVPRKAPLWGHINRDVKSAGARSARNSHAACDVAGVGNGITELPKRARRWKRRIRPRTFLRIYAPALDPTRRGTSKK